MPIHILADNNDHAWAVWKISEDEKTLAASVMPYEQVPEGISHETKRLEFLAGRVLLKNLLNCWSLSFSGVNKDDAGKPYLRDHHIHVSLTHSYPYVAAIIHRHKPVGIDLEQPKQKLLSIARRVLGHEELFDAGQDMIKHCIYWCAKESLIKLHGKKNLILSQNLEIKSFTRQTEGMLTGRIVADDISRTVNLQYRVYDTFVLVITR